MPTEKTWEASVAEILARIEAKLDQLLAATPVRGASSATSSTAGEIAPDADLDGKFGNPDAKWCPRKYRNESGDLLDYTGEDCSGRPFSDCNVEFLLGYTADLDYAADHPKPGKEKYVDYNRRDAARGRGWIKRLLAQREIDDKVGF